MPDMGHHVEGSETTLAWLDPSGVLHMGLYPRP